MGQPFSPERLQHIRRLRKARRLFAQGPLFALQRMQADFPGYTQDQLVEDLRRRTPRKKHQGKIALARYGRYSRMMVLIETYKRTRDAAALLKAQTLRRYMTHPYRVRLTFRSEAWEYSFCPLIPYRAVEELTQRLASCKTPEEAEPMVEAFRTAHRLS
ncbi:MAG: hypothetical protein P0Y53_01400 [Candidatus Pseudobacter hemicellulosilyticus]|uniref:Uncharacterized protein n=1 Tax=Candidatus Pseudobacter hemicellulosilyticus TaxID=3121375 RepID=A0AAJ5WT71_9BACT|nr:MAG: hypothetical protein P0Y53_01400 [Pseudobacter sp.]